jgi:hypothetical protein
VSNTEHILEPAERRVKPTGARAAIIGESEPGFLDGIPSKAG